MWRKTELGGAIAGMTRDRLLKGATSRTNEHQTQKNNANDTSAVGTQPDAAPDVITVLDDATATDDAAANATDSDVLVIDETATTDDTSSQDEILSEPATIAIADVESASDVAVSRTSSDPAPVTQEKMNEVDENIGVVANNNEASIIDAIIADITSDLVTVDSPVEATAVDAEAPTSSREDAWRDGDDPIRCSSRQTPSSILHYDAASKTFVANPVEDPCVTMSKENTGSTDSASDIVISNVVSRGLPMTTLINHDNSKKKTATRETSPVQTVAVAIGETDADVDARETEVVTRGTTEEVGRGVTEVDAKESSATTENDATEARACGSSDETAITEDEPASGKLMGSASTEPELGVGDAKRTNVSLPDEAGDENVTSSKENVDD